MPFRLYRRQRPSPFSTLAAIVCGLPFVALAGIMGNRIEPFFSLIRPGIHPSTREYVVLAAVLLLMPVGAFLALRPMLHRGRKGRRPVYPLNVAIAALLGVTFVALSVGCGTEVYRCYALSLPNCD